ncbi:hypothetical protein FF1_018443 [Malus domestica]
MMRIEELPQCSRSPTPGLELLQPEKGKKRWKMIEMIFLHPFQVSIIAAHQFAQTSSLSFVICRLLQKHALFKSATTTEARSRTPQLPCTIFQNPLSLWHAQRVMQRCHP